VSKRTLLIICSDPIVIAQHLIEIIRFLSTSFSITVCTNTVSIGSYSNLSDLSEVALVKHIPICREPSPTRDLRSLFALYHHISMVQYNLLLSFTPKAGLLLSLAYGLLRIFHPYSTSKRIHYFTGLLWQNLKSTSFKALFLRSCDFLICSTSSRILCDSKSQISTLTTHFPSLSPKFFVLGKGSLKGVDHTSFYPSRDLRLQFRSELALAFDDFVILFAGRVCRDKNISLLLSTFAEFTNHVSNSRLIIVGPIEDSCFDFLKLSPPSGVIYHPFSSSLNRYYNCADVLCLPSSREGFGSVVIEASACALPSVASFIPGLVDSVTHLETGLLFSLTWPSSLLSSLLFLQSNPLLRLQFSRNAFAASQAHYSQFAVLSRLQSFLIALAK